MKKLFGSIVICGGLGLFYLFYMNIQNTHSEVHANEIRKLLSADSLELHNDDLLYSLESIEGATSAVSGNILTVGFFLVLCVMLGMVGVIKKK